jgi:hypothetical protein
VNMRTAAWGLALAIALGPAPAPADDWDRATNEDDGIDTTNAFHHGSEQVHSLSPTDEDWYLVINRRFSSFEVRVDGMNGDLDLTSTDVQRLSRDGTLVFQDAVVTDTGGVLSLTWTFGNLGDISNHIKIHGPTCAPSCPGTRATYRVRYFDTTYTVPRFENSDTQQTTLIVQNATDRACQVSYTFFDSAATVLHAAAPKSLPARGLDVFRTSIVVPGAAGSIRIAHTCGYGGLSGKAVTLEPATGFAFETDLDHRPH